MLNKSGIASASYGAPRQILAQTQMQASMGCVVAQSVGVTVGTKKIAKAGTPITGSLAALTTALTNAVTTDEVVGNLVVPTEGGTVVIPKEASSDVLGVLLHDVDVTAGNANATILLLGFVNTNRLEADVNALITEEVEKQLNGKITFLAV